MTDTKLTDLTGAGTLDGTEAVYVVKDGADRKTTAQDIADLSAGGIAAPGSSTDNAIMRWDGTGATTAQDSAVTVSDAGEVNIPVAASPATPASGHVSLFGRDIAGRVLPAFASPNGVDSPIQPMLARKKIGYWNPSGSTNVVPGVFGFRAPTITGNNANTRIVATTNLFTRMRRLGYVTATTAGTVGQWRIAGGEYTTGDGAGLGGFTYIHRFGISDANPVATARMFLGMRQSATPTNVEPSTIVNCIGIGHGADDANLFLYYGGSAAQTPIDLGANFPKGGGSLYPYELALFSDPFVTGEVKYQVTRLDTGHVATGTLSGNATVLPQSTQLLCIWGYRTNNATALACSWDMISCYIETDY